ncbi:MAG: hypothetical protein AAF664_11040, partial [Planctomycetota bacterium]
MRSVPEIEDGDERPPKDENPGGYDASAEYGSADSNRGDRDDWDGTDGKQKWEFALARVVLVWDRSQGCPPDRRQECSAHEIHWGGQYDKHEDSDCHCQNDHRRWVMRWRQREELWWMFSPAHYPSPMIVLAVAITVFMLVILPAPVTLMCATFLAAIWGA